MTWTFSRPVRSLVAYYVNVNSGDTELFSTDRGPVNLALVAAGGNRASAEGYNVPSQPEGTYSGNVVDCESTNGACSGSIILSFPEGISSLTASSSGTPEAGYNDVGVGFDLANEPPAATGPAITTTSVPDATVGSTYRAVVAATGTGPIRYTVTSGTLPAGLSLDAVSGVISGTPTTAGRSTFTITATNSAGSDEHEFVLTTAAAAATVPVSSLPNATPTGTLAYTGVDTSSLVVGIGSACALILAGLVMQSVTKRRRQVQNGKSN
ncbi:Ig domain-containing protein [Curtobacterium sp. ME26]|uniref:Ig domain-containing protein n=1 Tax=Curtobacterium sp. ME26 TaxID=2744254 RepID=UPI0015F6926A|nr:Ig domain-containing protein [Curtobacterium sp. ME26]